MKLFKIYAAASTLVYILAAGCSKNSIPAKEVNPQPEFIPSDARLTCAWPSNSSVDSILTGYRSTVVQVDSLFMLAGKGIRQADTGYLGACNLPKEMKKNGLPVRISGYIITFPGIHEQDFAANPFELTAIEAVEK